MCHSWFIFKLKKNILTFWFWVLVFLSIFLSALLIVKNTTSDSVSVSLCVR